MTGSNPDLERDLARATELFAAAQSVLFVTGAGLSADSGLPTYRGVGGLYDDSEVAEDGLPIEVCLSGPMFQKDPSLTWRHIRRIEEACRGVQPNAGHRRIAELEGKRERVWVLTQNVDGLHHAAGSQKVIEIHGDTRVLRCTACEWRDRVEDYAGLDPGLPRCPECAAVIRPDVVLFGELLPPRAVDTLGEQLERGFDLVVSVGTSALFPYIAGPSYQAKRAGKPTIDINPGQSEVSSLVDVHVKAGAAEALDRIIGALVG